ncbi:unnamed protein product [Moneuplotes crassus]|uniref:Cyclic nucleotide-binding domain-containing protein n=1 Tax=Euplotes crassus TaxID=5936 RepID=A0AAD1Y9F5_EUPCR|nr:unnamed protein product [Moneuplotes crassus]
MSGPLEKIVPGTGGMSLHNQPPEVKKKSGAIRQIEEDDKTDDDSKESLLDYFIINAKSRWKSIFDIVMLFLVAYSCFTSIFYVTFAPPSKIPHIIFDWMVEFAFVLDMLFNFFQEYIDTETHEPVSKHKMIIKRYVFKGWFFIDFVSVFPFAIIFQNRAALIKLLRLVRLLRLTKLMNTAKVNQLLKSFTESSSGSQSIVIQHMILYCLKILRLVLVAIVITYFIGCFWFFISSELQPGSDDDTFVKSFELNEEDSFRKLIVSCYFALTTLSTVGYGDYYPISNVERVIACMIMLLGVAFFSYIMGNFIEIISNYKNKMGIIDRGTDLHNWMTLLTRFTNNNPLPRSLFNKIDTHFAYFWANDRLVSTSPDDELLNTLPRSIKRTIMTNYLFQDIFYKFKEFFNTYENIESKFLYDVSFGFMPRKFDENELIYDEESEVPEVYFIMEGTVGVGFRLPGNNVRDFKIIKYFREDSFFCDFYVLTDRKSEFVYQAVKETKTYALEKSFLDDIFQKYPQIAYNIRQDSEKRYKKEIMKPLHNKRMKDLEDYNEKSAYKSIQITNKDKLFEKNKKLLSLEKLDQKYTSSILKISDLQDWFLKEVGKMDTEIKEIKEETDRFREESKKEMEMMAEELEKAKERARIGKNG